MSPRIIDWPKKKSKEIEQMKIYVGDASSAVYPDRDRRRWQEAPSLLQDPSFRFLKNNLNITSLTLAHQKHTIAGIEITQASLDDIKAFSVEVDFLCTNEPGLGIGILTADCLPVLLYDPFKQALAAIHAGWRGALGGIVMQAIDTLQKIYNTNPSDLCVLLGPSARSCCYTIEAGFVEQNVKGNPLAQKALSENNHQFFFDIQTLVIEQLLSRNILLSAIDLDYTLCTMCNDTFCSYRRQKEKAGRQLVVAALGT